MLSLFFAVALGLTSCGEDRETVFESENQQVTLSVTEKDIDYGSTSFTVDVTADREFAAYATVDWLDVDPKGSVKLNETLTVTAQENTSYDARSGSVVVVCGGTRRSVTVNQAGKPQPSTEITAPEGYSLVWNDEFEGSELGSDWTFEVAGPGFVNNELQSYVKGSDVAEVSNGTLKINLFKDGSDIKSARIYAKRNQGWQYGYFEASIKLPEGRGTWPAFWMMPVNFKTWPGDGEIDIMESVGYDPKLRAPAGPSQTPIRNSTSMHSSGHLRGWCSSLTASSCSHTTTTAPARTPGRSTLPSTSSSTSLGAVRGEACRVLTRAACRLPWKSTMYEYSKNNIKA